MRPPVIDEYDAKMPFQFTGALERVQIHLSPREFTHGQAAEIRRRAEKFALIIQ